MKLDSPNWFREEPSRVAKHLSQLFAVDLAILDNTKNTGEAVAAPF
jgi:hypothetical protein